MQVIGIAHDSVENMKKNSFLEIPMIADEKRTIVEDYKTFMLKVFITDKIAGHSKVSRPISFLVNKDRKIVWKYLGGAIRRAKPEEFFKAIEENL